MDEGELMLSGVEQDIHQVPINDYCKASNDFLMESLKTIRKERKNLEIAKPDSEIKSLFKE